MGTDAVCEANVGEAADDVGIAASGRCDDEDALRQPRLCLGSCE